MELCRFLCSVKFVVRSLARFLGCDVCLWLQRSQGSRIFFEKLAFIVRQLVTVTAFIEGFLVHGFGVVKAMSV